MTKEARYAMEHPRYKRGLTLVELLVALAVASIILTAVATLAFALGAANDATDDTSQKQAQVRFATLRISELIGHSKLICGTPGNDLAVWRADDNGDGRININELVYIERGAGKNLLRLCEFTAPSAQIDLSQVQTLNPDTYTVRRVTLIPQCSNVEFYAHLDSPADPLSKAKRITITFNLAENSIIHQYQISSSLKSWAGNLLNEGGTEVVSDDD
jgi:prepilin-type N-terminal cleavage/methylation domain-containing protein